MKQQINHPNENTLEDQARQLLNDLEVDAGRQMTAGNLTELTELIAERNVLKDEYYRIRDEREKLKKFITRERYAAGIAENIALTCNDTAKARQHGARRAQCIDILKFIETELYKIE